jgi:hypothetical protein
VQKGIADLLHSLAAFIRCASMCLLVYTAMVVVTSLGIIKASTPSSEGTRRNTYNSPIPSSSHAYEGSLSRREQDQGKRRS